jgi:hypothetical protein
MQPFFLCENDEYKIYKTLTNFHSSLLDILLEHFSTSSFLRFPDVAKKKISSDF